MSESDGEKKSPERNNGKNPLDGDGENSKRQKTSSSKLPHATEDLQLTDLSSEVHSYHPLHLQSNENPGQSVIPTILTGQSNYTKWSRAMQIFLLGKGKLGFITGSCRRECFEPKLQYLWERCNAVVFGWLLNSVTSEISDGIMNSEDAFMAWKELHDRFNKIDGCRIYQLHMEIVTSRQGTDSVSAFYTRLKNLWTEFDTMSALPHIIGDDFQVHLKHKDTLRLFQFLMGLNEVYSNVRSNLLLWKPFPTVNQAYSMLLQEESQRNISASIPTPSNPVSASVSVAPDKSKKTSSTLECGFCHKKGHTSDRCFTKGCDFCKKKGHCKDNCFKLKGKAATPKGSVTTSTADTSETSSAKSFSTTIGNSVQGGIILTNEQFEKYLQTISSTGGVSAATAISTADSVVNSAGPLKWEGLGEWS